MYWEQKIGNNKPYMESVKSSSKGMGYYLNKFINVDV